MIHAPPKERLEGSPTVAHELAITTADEKSLHYFQESIQPIIETVDESLHTPKPFPGRL
jgi:hypothetical protein